MIARGVWGRACPPGNFCNLDSLRLLLVHSQALNFEYPHHSCWQFLGFMCVVIQGGGGGGVFIKGVRANPPPPPPHPPNEALLLLFQSRSLVQKLEPFLLYIYTHTCMHAWGGCYLEILRPLPFKCLHIVPHSLRRPQPLNFDLL